MMATNAVVGLRAGERLLGSSSYYSEVSEKLSCSSNIGFIFVPTTSSIISKKSTNYSHSLVNKRDTHPTRAVKEHVDTALDSSTTDQWVHRFDYLDEEVSEHEFPVDALLLLHKSLLEKQWTLTTEETITTEKKSKKVVTGSGVSARRRRLNAQNKTLAKNCQDGGNKQLRSIISPELLQSYQKAYLKGVKNEALLTHSEVVALSEKIKIGLQLEEEKSSLKERLGTEPSEKQLADFLKISQVDLQTKQMECTLAREKLTLSNIRLVMSVAQKYKHMGADMSDLIQGGLIGLLRGIEKYDSSRGHKISTYVYWWIRQGVTRTFFENSKTLRLPTHLHERLSAIRSAKAKLERKGITPSIDRIAETLNMSRKKVTNATEAVCKVFSLDKEAFPSLNGIPGDTLHSYIADDCPDNNPWHGVDVGALKIVVSPVAAGLLLNRFLPRISGAIKPFLPPLSVLATSLCVGAPLAININSVLSPFGLSVLLLLTSFHLSAFILGYAFTGVAFRNEPEVKPLQRTLSYETGMQSSLLALALANKFFQDPLVGVPPAISVVIMSLMGFSLVMIWAKKIV